MQRFVLAALLSSPALALVVGNTEAEEQAPEFNLLNIDKPQCVHSTPPRWQKRNSSGLFEVPKKVKKIYYINLDTEIPRNLHMKAELLQHAKGIPAERFPAFKKTDVPAPEKAQFKLYSKGRYTPWLLKNGQKEVFAAIHFSNYQVLEKILKEDPRGADSDDIYLIMEDDTQFVGNWQQKLEHVLAHTPKEWQLLRVGYWGQVRCEDKENEFVYAIQAPSVDKQANAAAKVPGKYQAHFYSGNTAYLVRPKSIPHILDIMRNSSVASIENVFMYPHRFPDGSNKQVLSYAAAPNQMIINPTYGFKSSH